LTAIQITHAILKAIESIDITAEIITPPSAIHQQLSFTTINTTLTGESPLSRTFNKIYPTGKQNWYGNLWFTGDQQFPSIRKNKSFKEAMHNLGKTTIVLNNINANPPTEIGLNHKRLLNHSCQANVLHFNKIS
jgi:hypothetical protein